MSDFKQAIQWLGEGKKVRRSSTNNKEWYIFLSEEIGEEGFVCLHHTINFEPKLWSQSIDMLEATDWEIYEEKKESLSEGFELFFYSQEEVKAQIKTCEGNHVQQVAYSSYHDAITQICFGCKKIRTSLKKEDLNKK